MAEPEMELDLETRAKAEKEAEEESKKYAALDADVRQGGVINTNHIRILLCYMVQNCAPVTALELQEVLCGMHLVNAFELYGALEHLCRHGHLQEGEDGFRITDTGISVATALVTELPLTIRERALDALLKLCAKHHQSAHLRAEILPYGKEFLLHCKMEDLGRTLLECSIAFPDLELAEHARERFGQNSAAIYQLLIAGLTGDRAFAAPFFEEPSQSRPAAKSTPSRG